MLFAQKHNCAIKIALDARELINDFCFNRGSVPRVDLREKNILLENQIKKHTRFCLFLSKLRKIYGFGQLSLKSSTAWWASDPCALHSKANGSDAFRLRGALGLPRKLLVKTLTSKRSFTPSLDEGFSFVSVPDAQRIGLTSNRPSSQQVCSS